MNLNKMIRKTLISMVAVAVIGAAVPTFADDQQHSRGGQSSGRAQGGLAPARAPQAQPRQAAPPQGNSGFRGPQAVQRPMQGSATVAPNGRTFAQPRGSMAVAPHAAVAPGGVAVSRGVAVPRAVVAPHAVVAVPRGSVAPYYAHGYAYAVPRAYYYPPHAYVVHPSYYYYPYGAYPYYAFHSHFSIGFGFFVGYPVAYPTWYNPYAVGSFGYGVPSGTVYGGLSFDMQPADAAVFIDGVFIGAAGDFGPEAAPLTLRTGLHHIELRADGFQAMAFDITVVPGQVIPYQGTMSALR